MAETITAPPEGFVMAGGMPPPPAGFAMTERRAAPRTGSGGWDALLSGIQSSGTGLALRGKLPDVVLDHTHSRWYENALETVGQMVPDIPQMVGGFAAGGAAGSAVAPGPGTIVGAGIGAFAVPAAIRESLIQAYESRDAVNSADFLTRAGIVIKETAKAGVVGGVTLGTGAVAARVAGSMLAPAIGQTIGVGGARAAIGVAGTGTEIAAMTVTPAALEGRLPEPQDFVNAAIVVGGMKAAGATAGKLANIYAKTGRTPEQVVADAKTDPAVKAELTAAGDKIPVAYEPLAEAEMLKNALPEPVKVQQVINDPRGTITDGKEPNHINYRYSETPEDVQALRAKIAETFRPEIESARGEESWSATQEKASDIIEKRLAGMSDDQQAELRKMSFEDLAAQSMAVEAMAQRAAFDARAAATELAALGENATAADTAKLVAAIEQSALLHAVDQQNGAEIARALNSRKAARQRGELAEGMTEMLAKYSTDPQVLARMVLGLHTTAELTKFAKDASKASTWEKVVEAWKASILSGPFTYIRNIIGNTSSMATAPVVDAAAAVWGKLQGAPVGERVSAVEPLARVVGNVQGALNMAKSAVRIFEAEGFGGLGRAFWESGGGKSEQFRQANTGAFGAAVQVPFKLLSSADNLFKTMISQGEANAQAVREVAKDGRYSPATREYWQRVADLAENPSEKMQAAMDKAAERQTYQTPLGPAGKSFQDWVRKAHMEFLFPFIRTPTNILKETARLTPLAPLVEGWGSDIKAGGAARDKAIAEVALGTTFMGAMFTAALQGIVTGAGDPDPHKRLTAVAAGWQPYSIKVGSTYYSYQGLGPLTTVLGMAADAANVWEHMDSGESDKIPKLLAVAFANAVTNQTALMGMTNLVNVTSDPTRYAPTFFKGLAGSVVPAAIAQPTAALDPVAREVTTILDGVKARIPGLRESLEPQINPLTGEAVKTKAHLAGVSPITMTDESKDKVLQEAARLQVGITKAPKSMQLPALHQRDIGKVELTDQQRTLFSEASGGVIHEAMANIVNTDRWDDMPDMMKKMVFDKVIALGHKKGRAEALGAEQREAEAQKILEKLDVRLSKRVYDKVQSMGAQ